MHGGGSCQISITYDESPTSSSTWKVITSIEGGCVARDTAGNLGADTSATAADPYTYNFTIPDNIPTGKAVLAWTWFNKVGNREMYMQCASIELTGTSGDQSNYDDLPDMFTANLLTQDGADPDCATVSDTDVEFPNPGDVVQKLNGATDAFAAPTGPSCGAAGSSAATTTAAASGGAAPTTTSAAAASTTAAGGGGIFATGGGSAPTTTSVAAPAATTGSSSSGSSSSSSGSSSSSSSSSEQSGACSTEGDYNCLSGGTTYQVCASGEWSVAMDVASGTQCSGTGSDFAIVAAASKKSRRFRKTREERRAIQKRGLGTMFDRA